MPLRVVLLAAGFMALATGVAMGLVRAGWRLPDAIAAGSVAHADVILGGFFGTVISLVSPVDSLWRRAAVEMSPGLTGLQFSPFGASNVPSNAMIVWAVGFTAVAIALAVYAFRRRPL